MKRLSPERKCLIILGAFNFIALAIFLPISAVFNLWGLAIGWIIGAAITFINMFLLFKTGTIIADQAKANQGTAMSVLFYLFRFLLIAGAMVICALMQYKMNNPFFTWSLFTCAASVLPSALIITIFYHSDDNKEKTKVK